MGHTWFADVVFEYLLKNKNIEINIQELMHHTGKSREQVQGAINNLRRRKGAIIVSPVPGRVYVYQGIGQAMNVQRGSTVQSVPTNANPEPTVESIPIAPVEKVMEKTEMRLKTNPDNPKSFGTALGQEGVQLSKGKFVIPKPHTDNEFMRVLSRKQPDRVVLEDAEGTIWIATEL